MTSYICQYSQNTIEISWCDKKGGITSKQASLNKEAIKKIMKDHPNQKNLKTQNFKIWQVLNIFCRSQNFIHQYLQHTNVTKMMHCVVIIKSILDWNKNTKSWFNKYWYSQIASVVGCHYNTVKKATKLVLTLWLDNKRKFSSYQWMDFIIFLFKRRNEASNKTRTILWLYKANAIEGQLSKRYENKPKKTFDKPVSNNPPDEAQYFTNGF